MNRLGKGGCIMKTRSFFMLSLAVMAMSCAKEVLPENNPENNPEENVELKLVPMEFTTALETKAGIVDGEGTVEWAANDAITVFDNLGGKNTFTTAVGGATSVFTGEVTEGATAFYALYPERTSAAEFDKAAMTITSKLFPDQAAVLGSYAKGNGGAVMVAKADAENRLAFKNMTSHIRFTLAEDLTDVVSITLMGNRNETLAGLYTIDFSTESPTLKVTKAETYVTLRNGGKVLEPGDYFFTVVPVEFEEGFTVILSMKDGSQVAKKTTKSILSLNQRNQVLPMAKLASTDYEPHMNYFVKYNDGFDLTFGGYTFNKDTFKDDSNFPIVRVRPETSSIKKDGIYFVPASIAATVDYNSSSLILIGEDSSQRSAIVQNNTAQPNTTDGIFLCANLHYTLTRIETKANVGTFDKIIFDNCKIINTGDGFLRLNNGAVVINDFVVSGCDIEIQNPKGAFNFVTGNRTGTEIVNTNFYNNVFYVNSTVAMTGFVLLNEGDAGTVKYPNIILSYNTFDKTPIGKAMVYATTPSVSVSINYNVFLEANITGGLKYVMGTSPNEVSVENNFFYKGDYEKGVQIYNGFTGNNPISIDDPRVSNWNPALGICSLNTITYKDKTFTAGAQREVVASPETANYAAANYVSVDYGTL